MKRKLISIGFALTVLLTLAACGNKGGGSAKEDGKTTIDFAIHVANPADQEPAFNAVVEAFKKENPEIDINLEGKEQSEHVKNMKMRSQSDKLPDIFWMLPASAKELQEAGVLADLSDFLKDNKDIKDSFDGRENMIDPFKDGKNQYGMPYQPLVTGLYYNKKVLSDNGFEKPETFEDLMEIAKTLDEKDIVTISKGAKDSYSVWAFLIMLSRYGYLDKVDDILAGKEKYNNKDFIHYYEKIAELRDAGAFPKNVSTQSYFQAVEQFTTGKSAMLDSGSWDAQKIESSDVGSDVGFWWGPTFNDGVGNQYLSSIVPSAPLVVSKAAFEDKDKKAAIEKFLAFYYGQEGIQIMVDNKIPPMTNISVEVDEKESPVFADIINNMEDSKWTSQENQPDLVVSESIGNAMYDSIYGVIVGNYTPEEAAKVVQNRIDDTK